MNEFTLILTTVVEPEVVLVLLADELSSSSPPQAANTIVATTTTDMTATRVCRSASLFPLFPTNVRVERRERRVDDVCTFGRIRERTVNATAMVATGRRQGASEGASKR